MIVTILIVLVCICLSYILLCRWYFPENKQVVTFPGKWPVVGHAYKFFSAEETFQSVLAFGEYSVKIGDITKIYLGPVPFYVVTDAEDVSTVVNKCLDKMFVYNFAIPLLGNKLIVAEVPVWKQSRRIVDLCFKQHILNEYLQLFNERAERFVETLAEDVGQEVDLKKKITRSVLETSWLTTLGVNFDGNDEINDSFARAINVYLDTVSDRFFKPWLMIDALFNMSNHKKEMEKSLETIHKFTMKIVQQKKAKHLQRLQERDTISSRGGEFQSVLDIILENSVSETESLFTDVELRDFMDNVLTGAFDTTIYEMLYVLICIGSSSEVQDKILQEMNKVLGKDGRLQKDNLSQLVYLDAVLKETLRLYPIASAIGRDVKTPTKLRNVTIPAGCYIIVHIWHTNRNPRYWGSDAEEFRPERWLDSSTLPKHQAAFATFGPGKRGCVGKSYALMYLKATVVTLLRKYKLTADHTKMKFKCKAMIKPESGYLIKIDKRN